MVDKYLKIHIFLDPVVHQTSWSQYIKKHLNNCDIDSEVNGKGASTINELEFFSEN